MENNSNIAANVIRIIVVVLFTVAGGAVFTAPHFSPWLGALIGCIVGASIVLIEVWAKNFSIRHFSAGAIGLALGGLASYVVKAILDNAELDTMFGGTENADAIRKAIVIFSTLVFIYLGVALSLKGAKHFNLLLPQYTATEEGPSRNIIVDTSVIIDGRIADIVETGFVEGMLIIPRFVLKELQIIADSSDPLKRTRGRRGLDILNRIQKDPNISVNINETDFPDIPEVDSKLVKLAKMMNGKVFTNDYNLNKVAEFQQVSVLNINDLANALKPVILPGETMVIRIVREGKEMGQGVAYLDDGTMVVVNDGKDHISQKLEVSVTSVLQTSAGRMIFAEIRGPA